MDGTLVSLVSHWQDLILVHSTWKEVVLVPSQVRSSSLRGALLAAWFLVPPKTDLDLQSAVRGSPQDGDRGGSRAGGII